MANRFSTIAMVFGLAACALLLEPVRAQTIRSITVDPIDDDAPQMGCTLREAIELANTNQLSGPDCTAMETGSGISEYEILLPEMIYAITGLANDDANQSGDLDISVTVRIIGAGRDLTIIDGQQLDRLFELSPGTGSLHLESLTLRNGDNRLTVNPGRDFGGAVLAGNNTRFTALDVDFLDNFASGQGGAVYLDDATSIIRNCRFERNRSNSSGAAIRWRGDMISTLEIDDSQFLRNEGGSTISAFSQGATSTLRRVLVAENLSTGISHSGATMVLVDSTIRDNVAEFGGGLGGGSFEVANTSIFGNRARRDGGGAILSSSTLTNVTIVNNRAGTSATLSGEGGGIFAASTVRLKNTIVAGNTASQFSGDDCFGEFESEGFNLIGSNDTCLTIFPGGTPNVNNDFVGTPGLPVDAQVTEDRLVGVAPIDETSIARDAIPAANCVYSSLGGNPIFNDGDPLLTDQRGVARDALCDIGAFEILDDVLFSSGFEQ